ncbi:MAG: histidine phosphatase family protein [Actinomycetota bacterium]|nr:histidine phosphatase family protein [Actinomycetota bacterium]
MAITRLTLVCHASTEAVRQTAFALDEPLDHRGAAAAAAAGKAIARSDQAWCGPSLRTRETAAALGLEPQIDAALDECDYGSWRGRRLAELEAEHPAAIAAWVTDPAAAPHGGETINELLARVDGWLTARAGRGDRTLAVTHASVIRAAVVAALRAPAQAFWQIDVAPLSQTVLHERAGSWTLRATGLPS